MEKGKQQEGSNWAFPDSGISERGPGSISGVRDRALSSARPSEKDQATDSDRVWIYFKSEKCRTREGKCETCKKLDGIEDFVLEPHEFQQVKFGQLVKWRYFAKRKRMILLDFPKGFKPPGK